MFRVCRSEWSAKYTEVTVPGLYERESSIFTEDTG